MKLKAASITEMYNLQRKYVKATEIKAAKSVSINHLYLYSAPLGKACQG